MSRELAQASLRLPAREGSRPPKRGAVNKSPGSPIPYILSACLGQHG
jgi:hypothetical protein